MRSWRFRCQNNWRQSTINKSKRTGGSWNKKRPSKHSAQTNSTNSSWGLPVRKNYCQMHSASIKPHSSTKTGKSVSPPTRSPSSWESAQTEARTRMSCWRGSVHSRIPLEASCCGESTRKRTASREWSWTRRSGCRCLRRWRVGATGMRTGTIYFMEGSWLSKSSLRWGQTRWSLRGFRNRISGC